MNLFDMIAERLKDFDRMSPHMRRQIMIAADEPDIDKRLRRVFEAMENWD